MMTYIFKKVETEVERLGESIEHMEIDTDDFKTVYIKIKPSERIDDDFYLVGTGDSIMESLEDIMTNRNGIDGLINKLLKVEAAMLDDIQDKREQKQWYESQI